MHSPWTDNNVEKAWGGDRNGLVRFSGGWSRGHLILSTIKVNVNKVKTKSYTLGAEIGHMEPR